MRLIRVAHTPWLRSLRDRAALAAVAARPRRVLAGIAAPSVMPALSPRIPTPAPLAELLRAIGGRIVVTNPVAVARLPHAAASLARASLERVLGTAAADTPAQDDGPPGDVGTAAGSAPPPFTLVPGALAPARGDRRLTALLARLPREAREALAPGAAWIAVALYEPDALEVQLGHDASRGATLEPPPLVAFLRYRLVLATGRGEPPPSWDALDDAVTRAPVVAWPPAGEVQAWFAQRLLVTDAHVAAGMDAATLARWAALTGRAGPAGRDDYWHAETWERFREPGRRVGHVTPQVVGQSRRARRDGANALALTPDVELGVGVPPGYGLVDCAGLLDVAVLAA